MSVFSTPYLPKSGKAVTPVLTYADRHSRTGVYVEALREKAKAINRLHVIYETTGTPIHTAYAPAQLWRLVEGEEVSGRT